MARVTRRHRAAAPAALLIALGLAGPASAQEPQAQEQRVKEQQAKDGVAAQIADPGTLRICAAEQAPLSIKDGSGLENRIATAVAEAMGRKPVFVWSGKPAIYLVRDGLDKKTCDVVVGLDSDDPRVLTTKPYYRSGYVFLTKAEGGLDVKSWADPRLKDVGHMVVGFGTPGEAMLKDIGRYEEDMAYLYSLVNFRAPRNQYTQIDPARMVNEVASGKADVGVAFAPDVARYVRDSQTPLRMTPVPDDTVRSDGQRVPQSFDQAMGVRKGDEALRDGLNAALAKAKPQIDVILKQEGVPVMAPSH
ncbi:methanol oxidation system protein MoxJ [Methylobacterium durans]|uniref:Methanol oxidation system protein MoxJ n=1 Tax=Methylobacterium durans TaxID=2202825 RepID=A0A2U8W4U2_9HYPH|nr:methanol oxidation system protein MoxJ [Methylobacterium durans]AWN40530.1 methanol oxidation system protein MoxJ [Methylobacterium durans]